MSVISASRRIRVELHQGKARRETNTIRASGVLPENVGGSSVIVGRSGERMDRDYNGVRGIYLRALGDTPALRAWPSAYAASVDNSRLNRIVGTVAYATVPGNSLMCNIHQRILSATVLSQGSLYARNKSDRLALRARERIKTYISKRVIIYIIKDCFI